MIKLLFFNRFKTTKTRQSLSFRFFIINLIKIRLFSGPAKSKTLKYFNTIPGRKNNLSLFSFQLLHNRYNRNVEIQN